MNYLCVSLIVTLSQFMLQIYAKLYYGYRSDNVPSLCDDPQVYSADRLVNNTVRLYRDQYYWELKGIPGTKGFIDGPYYMWYKDFGTTTKNTALVTFLTGYRKGFLTKFEGRKWWAWQPNGYQGFGDHGVTTDSIPKGGFKAVFHNGNATHPMLIALESIKVYYYNTQIDIYNNGMQFVGNRDGYMGGQYGENFPPDVTAAFSYPSTDPEDGYFVYLFKADKYCFRAAYRKDSTKSCDEWRPNRELFGCDGNVAQPPSGDQQPAGEQPPPKPNQPLQPDGQNEKAKQDKKKSVNNGSDNAIINYSIVLPLLLVFCLFLLS